MVVTSKKRTPTSFIIYAPESNPGDFYYVITKSSEMNDFKTVSYQVTSEEIGNKKIIDFVFDPGYTYHICPCSRNIVGDYSIVMYYGSKSSVFRNLFF